MAIRHVQQSHQPQPTIQLPVYVNPSVTIEWVRGYIYEPTPDHRGFRRLIEQRQVRYGEELAFNTNERGENIEFQIMGIHLVDGREEIVAGRRGYAYELDVLHSIHLD